MNHRTATAHLVAQIDTNRCSGCGRCISACAPRLFEFQTQHWKKRSVLRDVDRCSGCGECAARCATGAIEMVAAAAPPAAPTLVPASDDRR